ncbi:hypothetical protein HLB35_14535 [Halomonas sp. TBZ9]|uniref:Uncharacterized protein n=1 Tax=Vreelandella azerica TaxID=2732867 RepID=A0A7Y3XBV9_9GAMM|nr:hypothetical protein [Halomonas azerica]
MANASDNQAILGAESWTLSNTAFTADVIDTAVADLDAGVTAVQDGFFNADEQAVIDGATNTADVAVTVPYTLTDTLANLVAADAAVISGAESWTLSNTAFTADAIDTAVADLNAGVTAVQDGFFNADEQAVIDGATNTADVAVTVPYTLTDTLANLVAADAAVISGAESWTLSNTAFTADAIDTAVADLDAGVTAVQDGFFNADEQAVIDGATNTADVAVTVPYTLTDTLANLVAADAAVISGAESWTLSNTAFTADAIDTAVADLDAGVTAAQDGFFNADEQAVIDGATNTADVAVTVPYTLTDTLANLVAADAAVISGAESWTLSNTAFTADAIDTAVADLDAGVTAVQDGFFNADEQAVIDGATNTADVAVTVPYTLTDTLANLVAADAAVISGAESWTLSNTAFTADAIDTAVADLDAGVTAAQDGFFNADEQAVIDGATNTADVAVTVPYTLTDTASSLADAPADVFDEAVSTTIRDTASGLFTAQAAELSSGSDIANTVDAWEITGVGEGFSAALAAIDIAVESSSLVERLSDDIINNTESEATLSKSQLNALIDYREAIQRAVELAETGEAQVFFNGADAPDLTAVLNNLVSLSVDGAVFTQANADTAIALVSDVAALAAANPEQLNALAEVAFTTLTGGVDATQFSEMLGELATQLNDESISIGGLSLDAQSVTQLQTLFDGLGAEAQAVALASAQDLQINELLDPQAFFTEAFAEALKLEVESNETLGSLAFQPSLVSFIEKVGQLEGEQFEAADFGSDGLMATLASQVDTLLSQANPAQVPAGVEIDGDTVSFNGLSLSVSQLESAVTGYGNLNPESQATYLENLNNPNDLSLLTDLGSALQTQVVQSIASETEDQAIVLGEGDYEGVAGVVSGSGDDNITGSSLDNTIDISAGGSDTLTFAASLADNGTDTITGFSVGATADGGDVIDFEGLPAELGTNYEVNPTGELGADIGLLVFTTTAGSELSELGLTEGDTIMVLEVADNGSDAQLLKVEVGASDSTTHEQLATFEGLGGNLGNIVDDNLQDFNLTNT